MMVRWCGRPSACAKRPWRSPPPPRSPIQPSPRKPDGLSLAWAHFCHICAGTGSLLPDLRQNLLHPCHICTRTRLAVASSAPSAETGFNPAASARGLRSHLPDKNARRDWAMPCHICTGTALTCQQWHQPCHIRDWIRLRACHHLRWDWALGPGPALPHLFRH
jgi:hypothetical protein